MKIVENFGISLNRVEDILEHLSNHPLSLQTPLCCRCGHQAAAVFLYPSRKEQTTRALVLCRDETCCRAYELESGWSEEEGGSVRIREIKGDERARRLA
jgi:hypothetical protein